MFDVQLCSVSLCNDFVLYTWADNGWCYRLHNHDDVAWHGCWHGMTRMMWHDVCQACARRVLSVFGFLWGLYKEDFLYSVNRVQKVDHCEAAQQHTYPTGYGPQAWNSVHIYTLTVVTVLRWWTVQELSFKNFPLFRKVPESWSIYLLLGFSEPAEATSVAQPGSAAWYHGEVRHWAVGRGQLCNVEHQNEDEAHT